MTFDKQAGQVNDRKQKTLLRNV